MRYLRYFLYVLKHKFWVMVACFHFGLYWQGLTHDLSKFRPSEFFPYANFFWGDIKHGRDATGYYKPTDTGDDGFDKAWFLHQKRNAHHWEYWVFPGHNGEIKVLDMPQKYLIEMLCDWWGAGKAQKSNTSVKEWFYLSRDKMQLSEQTKNWIGMFIYAYRIFRRIRNG